jgi:hypothetical protein
MNDNRSQENRSHATPPIVRPLTEREADAYRVLTRGGFHPSQHLHAYDLEHMNEEQRDALNMMKLGRYATSFGQGAYFLAHARHAYDAYETLKRIEAEESTYNADNEVNRCFL